MEITIEVARLGESLSRSHQESEKSFRPERRRPRRHQHLIARKLQQPRQTQCVKMRGQFVLLPDSKAYLMRLNTNILCLPPLRD